MFLLYWNGVVLSKETVVGRQDKDEGCRHHDGKWLYKLKLRALGTDGRSNVGWKRWIHVLVLCGDESRSSSHRWPSCHHRRPGGDERLDSITRGGGCRFACPESGLGHLQVALCAISARITKSIMPARPVPDSRAWKGWVAVKSPWRR